jgi:hypothetical protein
MQSMRNAMLRLVSIVIAVAVGLPVLASAAPVSESAPPASAAPERAAPERAVAKSAAVHTKRKVDRHWHGYGFLPGYPPAPRIDPRQGYWYGGPGFYRGQWNGGGFGPCWTKTPIGPVNNC